MRPLLAALLIAVLAGSLSVLAAPAPVSAASPDLTLVTDARYLVEPEAAAVHVTVDITATNHRKDTATKRYWYDYAYLAVLPGTSGLKVSADGLAPSVKLSERTKDYDLLRISFGKKLMSGESLDLRLSFDLKDPGGAADRDVRVGQALVTFPVWAYASDETPGSTVEVVLPQGYHVEFAAGSIPGPETVEQTIVYRTEPLARPLEFFAYLVADREGAYVVTPLDIRVGDVPAPVEIRAWSDDPGFVKRVGDLFSRGLPQLGTSIGLDYPRTDVLTVQESVSRTLGGYAGLFDPTSGRIQVDYAAGPFVVLHEAAHVWFNGSLLADRWANEAFASYYASVAAAKLEVSDTADRLTPELETARIPLNAWGALGESDVTTEDYGYAASYELASAIAERAGQADMEKVWLAAQDRESAYQPVEAAAQPERIDAAPDWRGLLDLLEERTGQRFDDLWRAWVVRPDEAKLLDVRSATREQYATVRAATDGWELPRSIRTALTAWRFEQAAGLLAQASAVLDQRSDIETAAAAAGLTLPDTLQMVFEGDRGFPAAAAEAKAERATIDAIVTAAATEPTDPGPIERIGLLGSNPEVDLAAARTAFGEGQLTTAVERADAARAVWTSAGEVGGRRALSILGAGLLVLLALVLGISGLRARRARRARARQGQGPGPADGEEATGATGS
jgi:hypothetical protein